MMIGQRLKTRGANCWVGGKGWIEIKIVDEWEKVDLEYKLALYIFRGILFFRAKIVQM